MKDGQGLILGEEVFRIVGAAMEVHRELGHGFLEAVYQEALGLEMAAREIPFEAQVPLQIRFKSHVLEKRYVADFMAFDDIVVEIKSLERLGPREVAQLLNYLHATGKPLGLLVNFGSPGKLEWKRLANSRLSSRSF